MSTIRFKSNIAQLKKKELLYNRSFLIFTFRLPEDVVSLFLNFALKKFFFLKWLPVHLPVLSSHQSAQRRQIIRLLPRPRAETAGESFMPLMSKYRE
ncbi:hypothetical protein ACH95_16030 [Bacillus glycinifermentans]|nr:hypothetical protein ACH95_16030 [Bacillus glycinifermentans]